MCGSSEAAFDCQAEVSFWFVRLCLLDINGGRMKCASKLLSHAIDLLMASKNVAFELSVNLPTVGTNDESKCEP